jgi:hypothetical protein
LGLTDGHQYNVYVRVQGANERVLWTGPTAEDTTYVRWYVDALRADSVIATFEETATFTLVFDAPGE